VSQVVLKLLNEEVLLQLLAIQELLAERKVSSPLLGLVSLRDQQVIVPLEGLMILAGLGDPTLRYQVFQPAIGGKGQFLKASCHRGGGDRAALKGIL
jgi:hypothetical protein